MNSNPDKLDPKYSRQRAYYARLKLRKLCPKCTGPKEEGYIICANCREYHNKRRRKK